MHRNIYQLLQLRLVIKKLPLIPQLLLTHLRNISWIFLTRISQRIRDSPLNSFLINLIMLMAVERTFLL